MSARTTFGHIFTFNPGFIFSGSSDRLQHLIREFLILDLLRIYLLP